MDCSLNQFSISFAITKAVLNLKIPCRRLSKHAQHAEPFQTRLNTQHTLYPDLAALPCTQGIRLVNQLVWKRTLRSLLSLSIILPTELRAASTSMLAEEELAPTPTPTLAPALLSLALALL